MKIQIRPFKKKDKNQVIDLWKDCGLVYPANDPSKDIQRKLKIQPQLFLVAIGENRIVGTVMGGYEGHRGWINYLAVSPSIQKTGIGHQLMNRVEKSLRRLGCPKINLQIRETNSAVRNFYERIGYAQDKVLSYGKRLIPDGKSPKKRT